MQDSFSFLILLVILFIQFSLPTLAYVSNNRNSSWIFWGYDDGYRRCENICIIVFVISSALFIALCACGIFIFLRIRYKKKKSKKEKDETYSKETDGNSMDEIYV
ncbi:hypothetical protein Glove_139g361 [Diversispora epigaea]|uniref:Uncharacterized protein n=1 Tax=Diversispora epigaea TaxID=1348612 RepID=A0A397IVU0_9GLOM|nr:hypothetical protein Glove_139g361 [Diversispora epigaea]